MDEFSRWVAGRHMMLMRMLRFFKREGLEAKKVALLDDADKQD